MQKRYCIGEYYCSPAYESIMVKLMATFDGEAVMLGFENINMTNRKNPKMYPPDERILDIIMNVLSKYQDDLVVNTESKFMKIRSEIDSELDNLFQGHSYQVNRFHVEY
jgi:hypothetical protein